MNVRVSLTRRGIRWRAIRDDVHAAETAGVKITRERVAAYAISGSLCVLGGAFQGYYLGSGSAAVSLDVSTLIVASLAVFVGGPGTILGPLAGALVIYGLGSVVTSISTSLNVSLYGQVAELGAALIALRFLAPRLGNRDLLSGAGWLLKTAAVRLATRGGPRGPAETPGQPAISLSRVAALTSAGPPFPRTAGRSSLTAYASASGRSRSCEGSRSGWNPAR